MSRPLSRQSDAPSVRWAVPRTGPAAAGTNGGHRRTRWRSRAASVVLVVLLLVLPPLLAFAIADARTPVYGARAELVYRTPPDSQRYDQEMRTQVRVLGSPGFLRPTATAFDMTTQELQEALEAEQVGESEMLWITASDTDAERSLELAQSVTEAYTDRLTGGSSTLDDQIDSLQSRLEALRERQTTVNARLSRVTARDERRAARNDQATASAQQLRLDGLARALRDEISELERRMTDYRMRELEGGPSVEVVAAPYLLDDPVSPQPVRSLAAGLLIGVVLAGGALVAFYARASRRPREGRAS
jgi:uncharacterized protein involved in exopolysaccharide biosynthesis